jgi:hypothetical protein
MISCEFIQHSYLRMIFFANILKLGWNKSLMCKIKDCKTQLSFTTFREYQKGYFSDMIKFWIIPSTNLSYSYTHTHTHTHTRTHTQTHTHTDSGTHKKPILPNCRHWCTKHRMTLARVVQKNQAMAHIS